MDYVIDLIRQLTGEALAPTTAAFALAAIGLNIHFGFTGLINMGQAAFLLVGAYGFAISLVNGLPLGLAVLIGLAGGLVFALILGVPTLKLRGDYLAIVTICAAEIIRMVGRSSILTDVTGGSNGITGSSYRDPFTALSPLPDGQTTILWFTYDNNGVNGWWIRIVAWALVALLCLIVFLLSRSPWGRVLKGIREDEDAVRSLGKNVFSYKMQALVFGGVIGSLAGIIYVLPSSVQPDALGRSTTFFIWTALLLGGAATVFGPVLGAILFFVVRLLIRTLAGDFIPASIMSNQQADQFSYVLVGIALMCLIIFRPQGILGNKKELSFSV
ncbi:MULTISPECIES: branched-chain amino acid ABC transporter permease [unclassified Frigoribacterium]|jgi:branched-chain amino acid transport system permease protein|uniref:branched-chain amino acid ABC transporter permease n=1 Tax=unclassified Frigoribacterium TaxID=2627005 RepID=UPI000F499918|nr:MULTISPECIES: branched-chain amino acid ABC transporter permease [unclassified Frigoribacterium]MBD8583335.1 branched-chain amino acid ABC transporter permease [Frigoribacterium sp. CFBP 8766]MBD8610123.1 branched-chain amino acid ABC transporter permease [Frigoribacterium sp. CFBP 13729]MBP1191877.1 branched-chain amino acid transport system permease protein [Frigoribacterium sp. PvP032]ROP75476.1 amino acid/amide ABC transporter membrane protein 2 (HAAT family) [Frigoribacterium sp. PhB107